MVDLLNVIENLVSAISPDGDGLTGLMFSLSWLIGIIIVIISIKTAANRGDIGRQAGSWSTPVWSFIIGICFITLPGLTYTVSESVFGATSTDPQEIFSYAPSTVGLFDSDSTGRTMIVGIVTIIQFMGYIAIMRGLWVLREAAKGNGGTRTFGPGFTFVVAGALAANFPLFIGLLEGILT